MAGLRGSKAFLHLSADFDAKAFAAYEREVARQEKVRNELQRIVAEPTPEEIAAGVYEALRQFQKARAVLFSQCSKNFVAGATQPDAYGGLGFYGQIYQQAHKKKDDPVEHKPDVVHLDDGHGWYQPVCQGCKWTGGVRISRPAAYSEAIQHANDSNDPDDGGE